MSERESLLLKEIVENYISYAKPVGSKSLCKNLNVHQPLSEMKWLT